jgi:stage III sporulation protein AB
MIVLKCINLILIIAIPTYLGICKAKTFGKRTIDLKEMKMALGVFKSKIEFTYEPITEIFEGISKSIYENRENVFNSFCINLKTLDYDVSKTWNEALNITPSHFKKEDIEVLKMLGKMLGKTDKTGQIQEIDMVSNFLDKQIELAEIEKSKNEKLYKTLGAVLGMTLAIVFC